MVKDVNKIHIITYFLENKLLKNDFRCDLVIDEFNMPMIEIADDVTFDMTDGYQAHMIMVDDYVTNGTMSSEIYKIITHYFTSVYRIYEKIMLLDDVDEKYLLYRILRCANMYYRLYSYTKKKLYGDTYYDIVKDIKYKKLD